MLFSVKIEVTRLFLVVLQCCERKIRKADIKIIELVVGAFPTADNAKTNLGSLGIYKMKCN